MSLPLDRSRARIRWTCCLCALLAAGLVATNACLGTRKDTRPAPTEELGPAPEPVLPPGPLPMAPPRLWLFDSEIDTAEPTEFTGFGGKWRIDRNYPSPRYFQSLCHEPSPSSVNTLDAHTNIRQRTGDIAIADGAYFTDVDISAYIKIVRDSPNPNAGLAFGIGAGDDFYLARIFTSDRRVNLERIRPRAREVIASGEFHAGTSDAGTSKWQLARVRSFGGEIEFFVDDVLAVHGQTDKTTPGMIGLWTDGSSTACFDEVAAAPR